MNKLFFGVFVFVSLFIFSCDALKKGEMTEVAFKIKINSSKIENEMKQRSPASLPINLNPRIVLSQISTKIPHLYAFPLSSGVDFMVSNLKNTFQTLDPTGNYVVNYKKTGKVPTPNNLSFLPVYLFPTDREMFRSGTEFYSYNIFVESKDGTPGQTSLFKKNIVGGVEAYLTGKQKDKDGLSSLVVDLPTDQKLFFKVQWLIEPEKPVYEASADFSIAKDQRTLTFELNPVFVGNRFYTDARTAAGDGYYDIHPLLMGKKVGADLLEGMPSFGAVTVNSTYKNGASTLPVYYYAPLLTALDTKGKGNSSKQIFPPMLLGHFFKTPDPQDASAGIMMIEEKGWIPSFVAFQGGETSAIAVDSTMNPPLPSSNQAFTNNACIYYQFQPTLFNPFASTYTSGSSVVSNTNCDFALSQFNFTGLAWSSTQIKNANKALSLPKVFSILKEEPLPFFLELILQGHSSFAVQEGVGCGATNAYYLYAEDKDSSTDAYYCVESASGIVESGKSTPNIFKFLQSNFLFP